MKLVSWNCRGLRGNQKIEEIKRIKQSEAKMKKEDSITTMKKIWQTGNITAVSSQGASGSIITWWDSNTYKLISKT